MSRQSGYSLLGSTDLHRLEKITDPEARAAVTLLVRNDALDCMEALGLELPDDDPVEETP